MRDIDYDLIANERAERYKRTLYRRLASCGDREYPSYLSAADILAAEKDRMAAVDALDGIVDISEGEEE